MTALTHVARERERLSLSETLADSRVIAVRQLRKVLRRPVYVVSAFVQPVLFVLMFRYVFGGAIHTGSVAYVDFVMPGIMVQTAIFGALITGMGLTEDMAAGVVDRFRSLPMARSAVLAGRTAADAMRNLFVICLMILVGYVVDFRFEGGFFGAIGAMAIALLFGYAFSWFFALVGLLVKDPETAQVAGFIPLFPFVFASSIFVSPETMPSWLQWFAEHQPVTKVVNAVRGLSLGTATTSDVVSALLWIAAMLLIFAPLATRQYRKG